MKLIERTKYKNELIDCVGTPDIKILTGVRRAGKSLLLDALIDYIKKNDPTSNIIRIDLTVTDYESLLERHALEAYIENLYQPGVNNCVLIDEVQMCKDFEIAINSLHARRKYDIYVTGSNAFLQSSNLTTLFVGRIHEIEVLPFSFQEYATYFSNANQYAQLTDYLLYGGMSGSYLYNPERRFTYINNDILEILIVRDIVQKDNIREVDTMYKLIDFLTDNIGNKTSIASLERSLKSASISLDNRTIQKYIQRLCHAYLFYPVKRYDVIGKKYLNSSNKYYLCDHSFRYARLGTKNMDYVRVLENVVAIELIRRGYEVYVGMLRNKEIDFVAMKQGIPVYIQVSYDISNEDTFQREVSPLLQIKDNYLKLLIARTYQPAYDYNGIQIVDASDWLLINGKLLI